ncbi:MAG: hypothetical protein LLG04_06910 [Parachlamydia sp.]|nr:hypothetical protein [Parachlamydia sp.]
MINFYNFCRDSLANDDVQGKVTMLRQIDQAVEILNLLKQAAWDPEHLVPILLSPIQSQEASKFAASFDNLQLTNLDPAAAEWMLDFASVVKYQAKNYLIFLSTAAKTDEQRSGIALAKAACKTYIQSSYEIAKEFKVCLTDMHQFQVRSRGDQQNSVDELEALYNRIERLSKSVADHHTIEGGMLKACEDAALLCRSQEHDAITLLYRQQISHPSRFYTALMTGALSAASVHVSTTLNVLHAMNTNFSKMDSPYTTLIDMIDCYLRKGYLALRQNAIKSVSSDVKQSLLGHFDQMIITTTLHMRHIRKFLSGTNTGPLKLREKNASFTHAEKYEELAGQWHACKSAIIYPEAQQQMDSVVSLLLNLSRMLALENWPVWWAAGSRINESESSTQAEKAFFLDYLTVVRQSLLQSDLSRFSRYYSGLLSHPLVAQEDRKSRFQAAVNQIQQNLNEFLAKEKERPQPKLETLEQDLHGFLHQVAEYQIRDEALREKMAHELLQACVEHPEHNGEVKELLEYLGINPIFEGLVLSPCSTLMRYYFMLNVSREGDQEAASRSAVLALRRARSQKPKPVTKGSEEGLKATPEAADRTAPVVLSKPKDMPNKEMPKDLAGTFVALNRLCYALSDRYLGFTTLSGKQERQFETQFQGEAVTNILHTMQLIQELAAGVEERGDCPEYAAEIRLRVAVLVEQTLKLLASERHVPLQSEEQFPLLLVTTGKECLWQMHAPDKVYQKLQEAGGFSARLTDEQENLLKDLKSTIAISSRYPHSGGDGHADSLLGLMKFEGQPFQHPVRQRLREKSGEYLRKGLETCLALLSTLGVSQSTENPQESHQESQFDLDKLKTALSQTGLAIEDDGTPVNQLIAAIQKDLKKIQFRRVIPAQREVKPLANGNEMQQARSGTIQTALVNLPLLLDLCSRTLKRSEDPAFCLTDAHALLRQSSAALEMSLLVHLAHAPVASAAEPALHYLWNSRDKTLKRYSHAMEEFATVIPQLLEPSHLSLDQASFDRIQRSADMLGPYLRQLYRYSSQKENCVIQPLLDKLKLLSQVWERCRKNTLQPIEAKILDEMLKVNDPEKRIEKLHQHICEILRQEVKRPVVQTLQGVADLVALYLEALEGVHT